MIPDRRRCIRQKLNSLVYVSLGASKGGRLLDLGERGFAFGVWGPAVSDEFFDPHFDLLKVKARIEAGGKIVWTQESGFPV